MRNVGGVRFEGVHQGAGEGSACVSVPPGRLAKVLLDAVGGDPGLRRQLLALLAALK